MIYLDITNCESTVQLKLSKGSKVYVSKYRHTQYSLSYNGDLVLTTPEHGMVKVQKPDGNTYFYIIKKEFVEIYLDNEPFILKMFRENSEPKWIELSLETCCL